MKNANTIKKTLGEILKDLRNGASQERAASIFGVKQTTYSAWERNLNEPPISILYAICKHYKVTADYLIGLTDSPQSTIQPKMSPEAQLATLIETNRRLVEVIAVLETKLDAAEVKLQKAYPSAVGGGGKRAAKTA